MGAGILALSLTLLSCSRFPLPGVALDSFLPSFFPSLFPLSSLPSFLYVVPSSLFFNFVYFL